MSTTARTFEYTVRDRSGQLVVGSLDAADQAALVARLRAMGHAPITVREAGTGLHREITLPWAARVTLKDLAVMARQFATMIDGGLSLVRALGLLVQQTESPGLSRALTTVRTRVEAGESLSTALAAHPRVFPPLMVNMCRAGEVGGFLGDVLLQLAATFEADAKLRAKIKSAMTYPVVVLVFALIAVTGMLAFIVPIFAAMYEGLGAELPAPTQVMMAVSSRMGVVLPATLVLAVAGWVLWRRVRHEDRVREVVDPLKLRVPVFGRLMSKVVVSRFSRNLGTMLAAGVPVLQSLQIVGETSGNVVVERAAADVAESVQRGQSLSGPLTQHPVFPKMLVQMLAVGEDSGTTDEMLGRLADFYDTEIEATTEQLTSLLEPLMIVVIGAIVGGMVLCLYLPMFGIFDAIG